MVSETIIYLRTSTEEQNPENQKRDCEELVKKLNIVDYQVLEEQKSAFKENVERPIFNSIIEKIKKRQLGNLIVWDLDRLYRNREKLIEFFEFCKMYRCKIYSVRQEFLNVFDTLKLPAGFEFLAEMYRNNFLQFLGWIAEEESSKRSERIKISIRKDGDVTKSRKGNKWGRKKKPININYILELHKQGLSTYEIAKKYSDDPTKKAKISHMTVYNIIKNFN